MEKSQQHNLKAKASKFKFIKQKVLSLGYEITISGLCPQKCQIEAMLQMAPPITRKLLQDFLRILNYYRRLCPTIKISIQHLVSVASPKVKLKWNQEANASFNNTKSLLAHATLLVHSDFDKPFHLKKIKTMLIYVPGALI